jgi:hypothetical protein
VREEVENGVAPGAAEIQEGERAPFRCIWLRSMHFVISCASRHDLT